MIKRYLNSVSKVQAIMAKIIEGTAPEKFTTAHLKTIGFGASNDRAMVPLLKDLGFLSTEGVPTKRYHDYRNTARSKTVLGEARLAQCTPIHLAFGSTINMQAYPGSDALDKKERRQHRTTFIWNLVKDLYEKIG